eukprot:TRINITY_DN4742_c0_g1_i1.p1 TRINITY_DN4742_c0_g1~~TRINITY_DN4742_c0_g1_i1.p1  ORF type:complete len:273 (+),score=57.36 TRINITY_DN4742_c0_g1_i1:3-821(+)
MLKTRHKIISVLLIFHSISATIIPQDASSCLDVLEEKWVEDADPHLVSSICSFERVHDLSNAEFLSKYEGKKPVIITVDPSRNSAFKEACSKHNLIESYGDVKIILSTANTHSYDKVQSTLGEYIDKHMGPQDLSKSGQETLYHFGDNNFEDLKDLFALYEWPPYAIATEKGVTSWGLGGSGSGVPFHTHGAVFAEVMYGQKRWFLYPPNQTPLFNPNELTLKWLNEVYPQLNATHRPLECTLGVNEIIYFPSHWWHATLNIGQSVFISVFI